jgi:hypothetical protein
MRSQDNDLRPSAKRLSLLLERFAAEKRRALDDDPHKLLENEHCDQLEADAIIADNLHSIDEKAIRSLFSIYGTITALEQRPSNSSFLIRFDLNDEPDIMKILFESRDRINLRGIKVPIFRVGSITPLRPLGATPLQRPLTQRHLFKQFVLLFNTS